MRGPIKVRHAQAAVYYSHTTTVRCGTKRGKGGTITRTMMSLSQKYLSRRRGSKLPKVDLIRFIPVRRDTMIQYVSL